MTNEPIPTQPLDRALDEIDNLEPEKLGEFAAEFDCAVYVAEAMSQTSLSITMGTAGKILTALRLLEEIKGYDLMLTAHDFTEPPRP